VLYWRTCPKERSARDRDVSPDNAGREPSPARRNAAGWRGQLFSLYQPCHVRGTAAFRPVRPARADTHPGARPSHEQDLLLLALLRAGHRPRPDLCLPSARPLPARGGASVQPAQVAARPLRTCRGLRGELEAFLGVRQHRQHACRPQVRSRRSGPIRLGGGSPAPAGDGGNGHL